MLYKNIDGTIQKAGTYREKKRAQKESKNEARERASREHWYIQRKIENIQFH